MLSVTLLNAIHDMYMYPHHCLLVPADLTLTTDRLIELFQSLEDPDSVVFPVSWDRYLNIGIVGFLGLPESAFTEIKKRYQSKDKRKEAYLDTYVHYHPCPSWKVIHEVLGKCSLHQQAEEVEVTYVQGMHALCRACTQCSCMYLYTFMKFHHKAHLDILTLCVQPSNNIICIIIIILILLTSVK